MRKKKLLQIAQEQQAAKLADLGQRLSQARQQLDLSLENVSERTHIQTRLLRAIEEGRIQDLPESVYVQSFIRQYANAIGLNGVHYAGEFMAPPDVAKSGQSWWKSLPVFGGYLRPAHLYVAYMGLVVLSMQSLSGVVQRSMAQPEFSQDSLQKFKDALPGNAVPVGPAPAPVTIVPGKKGIDATSGKPVRVGLTVTDESWIQVMADGQEAFKGLLPQGSSRNWTAQKQLVVKAGNAGAVMVSFNDGEAQPLGEAGSVKEVAFPPAQKIAAQVSLDP